MIDADHLLAVGGTALGTALRDPVDLGGSARSKVIRCVRPEGTVVVKGFDDSGDARRAFTAEASALAFGAGPSLLGADVGARVLVMADLGDAPTLADVLLGRDETAAWKGVVAWATALGRLAANSAGRHDEHGALRHRYDVGGDPHFDGMSWLIGHCRAELPGAFGALGVEPARGFDAELEQLRDEEYALFSPGDECPDNCLLTAVGARLLDFEGAGYRPVFLDAAYCRMPFPTCWCVRRLPADLARTAEEAYRNEVVRVFPGLADDAVWEAGLRRASVSWGLLATALLLARATSADRAAHPSNPAPSFRQLLRYRWRALAAEPAFPAIAETAGRLLAASEYWDVPPLGDYPAFVS